MKHQNLKAISLKQKLIDVVRSTAFKRAAKIGFAGYVGLSVFNQVGVCIQENNQNRMGNFEDDSRLIANKLKEIQQDHDRGVTFIYPRHVGLMAVQIENMTQQRVDMNRAIEEAKQSIFDWNNQYSSERYKIKKVELRFNSNITTQSEYGAEFVLDAQYFMFRNLISGSRFQLNNLKNYFFYNLMMQHHLQKPYERYFAIQHLKRFVPDDFLQKTKIDNQELPSEMRQSVEDLSPLAFKDPYLNSLLFGMNSDFMYGIIKDLTQDDMLEFMKIILGKEYVPNFVVRKMLPQSNLDGFEYQKQLALKKSRFPYGVGSPIGTINNGHLLLKKGKALRAFFEKHHIVDKPEFRQMINYYRFVFGADFDRLSENAYQDIPYASPQDMPRLEEANIPQYLYAKEGGKQLMAILFYANNPQSLYRPADVAQMMQIYKDYYMQLVEVIQFDPYFLERVKQTQEHNKDPDFKKKELLQTVNAQSRQWYHAIYISIARSQFSEAQKKFFLNKLKTEFQFEIVDPSKPKTATF